MQFGSIDMATNPLTLNPRWFSEDDPEVSIIILNFNNALLTLECLKSIWEHTLGYRYEVIVIDNGSQADDFHNLAAFRGAYKLLRLDVNRLFGVTSAP